MTGQGDWQWTDLIAATRGKDDTLCDRCSTKANKTVFHLLAECDAPGYIHDLPVFQDLLPDPARIQGDQVAGKHNKGKSKAATYPCKVAGCSTGKAFRKAHTANRHMVLEHKLTDADYEQVAYPDGDDGAAVAPMPSNSRGRHAKPKPAARKKKKKGTSSEEDSAGESDHDEVQQHEGKHEEEGGMGSEGDDDSEDVEDDNSACDNDDDDRDANPDEVVDIVEGQHVVHSILGHRLLNDGTHKYRVRWVGYTSTTWEKEQHLNADLKSEYHTALASKLQLEAAKQSAAKAKRGGMQRTRRGAKSGETFAQSLPVRLDVRANQIMGAEGGPNTYYDSYEQAQRELGYA